MYLKMMKNYSSMNLIYTNEEGHELWLGDYYAATNLKLLKQKRIDSVLTAAAMLGIAYSKEANINHKTLNAFDIPTYKMTKHFDQAFHFIKNGLSQGNVLVHCAAGISRSTTCIIVYFMRQKNYSFKKALQLIKAKRKIANPNYGFQNELSQYEIFLRNQNTQVKTEKGFSRKEKRTVRDLTKEKDSFLTFIQMEGKSKKQQVSLKPRTHQKMREPLYPNINSIIKQYNDFKQSRSTFVKSQGKNFKSYNLRPVITKKW